MRIAAGPAWDADHDWLLTDELGGFVRPQSMSYEWPRIRLHDLCHTHATLALKAGVHPKVVSERLGHVTVGITLDLYSHVVPSLARDAAEQIRAPPTARSIDEQPKSACARSCTIMKVNELAHS